MTAIEGRPSAFAVRVWKAADVTVPLATVAAITAFSFGMGKERSVR